MLKHDYGGQKKLQGVVFPFHLGIWGSNSGLQAFTVSAFTRCLSGCSSSILSTSSFSSFCSLDHCSLGFETPCRDTVVCRQRYGIVTQSFKHSKVQLLNKSVISSIESQLQSRATLFFPLLTMKSFWTVLSLKHSCGKSLTGRYHTLYYDLKYHLFLK